MNELKKFLIEEIEKMNDEEIKDLIGGINDITFEYGWADLDESKFIKTLWKIKFNEKGEIIWKK